MKRVQQPSTLYIQFYLLKNIFPEQFLFLFIICGVESMPFLKLDTNEKEIEEQDHQLTFLMSTFTEVFWELANSHHHMAKLAYLHADLKERLMDAISRHNSTTEHLDNSSEWPHLGAFMAKIKLHLNHGRYFNEFWILSKLEIAWI